MKEADIISDMQPLTTIKDRTKNNLINIFEYVVCDNITKKCNKDTDTLQCDIGIGLLTIHWDNDDVKFRFAPNGIFESRIKNAINGKDELVKALEQSLNDKIVKIYKELL